MKLFLTLSLLCLSTLSFAFSPEQAEELLKIHESTFTNKQIINNPDLCAFHNSLIDEAASKFKHEKLACSRTEAPATKEVEVATQLNNIESVTKIVEMKHPEQEELSSDSIYNYAQRKMISEGFGK